MDRGGVAINNTYIHLPYTPHQDRFYKQRVENRKPDFKSILLFRTFDCIASHPVTSHFILYPDVTDPYIYTFHYRGGLCSV